MKKLFLCLLTLSFIYCSNNDDDANGQDPIIGTWLSSQDGLELFEESVGQGEQPDGQMGDSPVDIDLTINFTFTFSQNGTLSSEGEIVSSDPQIQSMFAEEFGEMEATTGTWENTSSSPDFSNTMQVYNITTEGESEIVTINFDSSFTEFTISQEGQMLTFEKQ